MTIEGMFGGTRDRQKGSGRIAWLVIRPVNYRFEIRLEVLRFEPVAVWDPLAAARTTAS
jgi:hypothetical protein